MREEVEEVHHVVIVTVVTVMHTVVKVEVVMRAWTREVLVTTSNQNSVEEWAVLEGDVVDHQVEDSEHLHQPTPEDSVPHQVNN